MKLNKVIKVYRKTLKRVSLFHRFTYFFGEKIILPLLENIKQFYTPPDDPLSARLELLLGDWEPETVAFFKQVVRLGDYIMDIGAHVGYYTVLFAKLVGSSGKVVAIEPHPETFRLLAKNTRRYANIELLNVAAGESENEMSLYDAIYSGNASLKYHEERRHKTLEIDSQEFSQRIRDGLPVREYKVRVIPLDSLFITYPFRLVKIDIEGAEPLAIKGMSKIMQKLEILVFELDRGNLATFGYTPADLISLIQEFGLINFYELTTFGHLKISFNELIERGNALPLGSSINVVATRYPL